MTIPPDTPETLFHTVLAWARLSPSHLLSVEWPGVPDFSVSHAVRNSRTWSYRDTVLSTLSMADSIRESGLPTGAPVGLLGSPGYSFLVCFLALEAEGLLPILIDHAMPPEEVQTILERFGAKALFLEEGIWAHESVEETRRKIPVILRPRWLSPIFLPPDFHWKTILAKTAESLSPDSHRVACLLMTSGTTGFPRGVPLTHANLFSNIRMIRETNIYNRNSRVFGVLPLHHAYPLMSLIFLPIGHGATVGFAPDLLPATLLHCLDSFKATLFPGVPSLWEGFHRKIWEGISRKGKKAEWITRKLLMPFVLFCREKIGWNPGPLFFSALHRRFGPALEVMSSGGAALAPGVCRDFWSWGMTLLEGYGLTETSPVLTFNNPKSWKIGSVGRPLPGVVLEIRKTAVTAREEGEVVVSGPNVAREYWISQSERMPLSGPDGTFATGDLGILEDGFLLLKGREKELLVLANGKKLQPDSVESLLLGDPLIAEAGLTLRNGVPWLLIRPDEAAFSARHLTQMRPVLASIVANLNAKIPVHSRIGGFSLTLEALPRTRLGKLKRFEIPGLVDRIEHRSESMPIPEGSLDDPRKVQTLRLLQETIGHSRPVSLSDHLEVDLGLDSLGRIELAGRLEEVLGESFPDEAFESVRTVADLLALVSESPGGSAGLGTSTSMLDVPLTLEEQLLVPVRPKGSDGRIPWGYRLAYRMLRGITGSFFQVRWPRFLHNDDGWICWNDAGEAFPWPSGPCLIVANHESYLDGIILTLALPVDLLPRIFFWGYSPLFEKGILRHLRNAMGVISIDPEKALTGLRVGHHLLKEGSSLAIFPEGERSPTGIMQPFRPGTGYLLSASPVPVVPVALTGPFEALPRHRQFPRRHPIRIAIGKPISADRFEGMSPAVNARLLEEHVRKLLAHENPV
ncbi:MAG: AMP-binding protein [Leptospirales bacterium]